MPISIADAININPADYPASFTLFEALESYLPPPLPLRPATRFARCLHRTGEAKTLREAGRIMGLNDQTIYNATSRKAGRKLKKIVEGLFRKDMGRNALLNIVRMSEQIENLAVAMRANEWLAAFSGIAVDRSEKVKISTSGQFVGLTINLGCQTEK